MSCLVIVEQDNGLPNRASLATISAATKLSKEIDLLVLNPENIENIKKINGLNKIYSFNKKIENVLAENMVKCLLEIVAKYKYILAPSGTFSKNFMPRLGAILDLQPISDVIRIHDNNTFDRPIYAGNAIATVRSKDNIIMLTIRGTAFDPIEIEGGNAEVEILSDISEVQTIKFVSKEITKSERPDLSSAKIVVSGGRGVLRKILK